MVKVTFTLDEETIARLNETAERLSKPKSEVVREAIKGYRGTNTSDRLSEAERQRMLRVLKEYALLPPTRSSAETDRELAELRASRRRSGRSGAR
jgi:metal-responsive CopG/Arc/MetJ family transcriptional regulator